MRNLANTAIRMKIFFSPESEIKNKLNQLSRLHKKLADYHAAVNLSSHVICMLSPQVKDDFSKVVHLYYQLLDREVDIAVIEAFYPNIFIAHHVYANCL